MVAKNLRFSNKTSLFCLLLNDHGSITEYWATSQLFNKVYHLTSKKVAKSLQNSPLDCKSWFFDDLKNDWKWLKYFLDFLDFSQKIVRKCWLEFSRFFDVVLNLTKIRKFPKTPKTIIEDDVLALFDEWMSMTDSFANWSLMTSFKRKTISSFEMSLIFQSQFSWCLVTLLSKYARQK